ncbi:lytic murein transglycosylase [Microbaculum marinum]|uniref:Lytic murein transglycosylase n=1 Tax=Microbaculum marinum TaxID=1764581 RepID=A0AAW9RU51_9HYPH
MFAMTSGGLRAALVSGLAVLALSLATAAATADAGFDQWVKSFWPTARDAGISSEVYNRAFAGMTPDPKVLELANRQPEFTRSVADYMSSAVSAQRVETGQEMLRRYGGVLDAIEAKTGVSRYVVVAIWGMESSYGAVLDNPDIVRSTIRSLATLAYAGGRRSEFGQSQLLAALKILQNGDISPDQMTGSWAGAMGHTQFIPTTYLAYAVDFDGDGRRDIWNSIPDALGSTANYLRASKWTSGKTWGYEVELPPGFDYSLSDEDAARPLRDWAAMGVRRTYGREFPRGDDIAHLVLPSGAQGPAFLMLGNFRSILRYNNAVSYALAVGHLADRLAGGGPFATALPDERPLSPDHKEELQTLLTSYGYDTGGVDGRIGPMTRDAIRSYQSQAGLPPDGHAGYSLLERLRRGG